MTSLFVYHWKIYILFTLCVFIPQLILIFYPAVNLPGLGFAFVGVILMAKLMSPSEKEFLGSARVIALKVLNRKLGRSPSKSEVESFSRKIVESRLFAYYFSGVLALALGFIANAQS